MAETRDLRAMYRAGELTCSVEVAARALRLGRGSAYAACRSGELPGCLHLGNRYLISIPALLKALDAIDPEVPISDEGKGPPD